MTIATLRKSQNKRASALGQSIDCTQPSAAGSQIESLRKVGLRPVVGLRPKVLILGTLPGDVSIARQQYYGHRQNAFWRLVSKSIGQPFPEDYTARLGLLKRNRIALWDVLGAADRQGSSDAAIRNEVANDIAAFVRTMPSLTVIVFNGQKAQALFKRHIAQDTSLPNHIAYRCVPSSSPLATQAFESKAALWRTALTVEA